MPVFDTNDYPIKAELFADKLIGAMCEITFTLRHYSIGVQTKPGGARVEAHDVFSAKVEAVSVLKNPPVIVRSPFKGRTKRPHHRPQIPTRGEQVSAANAFVPQPNFGLTSTTHQTVAANIAATFPTHGAPSTYITISGDGSTLPLQSTPIDATDFPPPVTTPIDAVITAGEGPVVPINACVATSGNSPSIASTSTSGTTKGSEALDSTEADHSVTQAPPLKKRKLRD